MTTSQPDSDPPVGSGGTALDLAAIWHVSRGVLEEQVNVIERAVVAGIERRLTPDDQLAAGREAHKLAGSLGTFGFGEGSRLARELELTLTSTDVITSALALELSALVVGLRSGLNRPLAARSDPRPGRRGDAGSLLVTSRDADWNRRVVEAAVGQGFAAASAGDLDAAIEAISHEPPDVVVVDDAVGPDDDLAAFLAAVADHRPPMATVVVTGAAGLSARVATARLGVRTVIEQPAPPDAVVHAVTRLLGRVGGRATVLVVDDDPTFLMIVEELLRAEGLAVEPLGDARGLWGVLERVRPDLLLLDNEMPGVDGISLCRAIRSDERWTRLPIVFLSGSHAPDVVRRMFTAGADDFVSKPVSPGDLVARVASRIERSRAQLQRAGTDLTTGLPTARMFVQDATRLLGLSQRAGAPASLVLVELDPPGATALAALGRLLRQAAAPEDAIGAWSEGRLAELCYGCTAAEAQERVEQVLRVARAAGGHDTPKASAGVAASPEDGSSVRALSVAAESALGRARLVGGDAVERHEAPGRGRREVVDVLLVDDDEALGALVVHALSGRGWSLRWLRDGAEAVDLLDNPVFRAKVVLLDVGLPGLDGIAVLRHLGQRGLLATTRVVMLTVRANESEVLEALDLGAFDHVAKPFSLGVLVHRVRRALEASG
ncbi:MAG: response regulator [Acidimicrobiales bacterium]